MIALLLMPLWIFLAIYIGAAVIPAVFLMRYIYRKDKMEKEPDYLLFNLVVQGVLAALCSIVLESIGEALLPHFISTESSWYVIVLAFLVVAGAEEGTKFFFMKRATWKDPNFNYRFDAIVYAAFVSLGFAAFENISYVFSFGITVAPLRAILSIPGHLGFSVFMGFFYGRAKLASDRGEEAACRRNLRLAVLSAVFLHGFYDACAMLETTGSTLLFLAFVAFMYIVVIRMIRRESATDARV